MAKFKIKAFGITREILGGREVEIEMEGHTVGDLENELKKRHPRLAQMPSMGIAVNQAYAGAQIPLEEDDEIALIPPVSGG